MSADGWKSAKTLDQKRAAVKALKGVQGKLAPKAQELATTAAAAVSKMEKDRGAMLAQGKLTDSRYKLINRKTGKTIEVENHSRDDNHKLQTADFKNAGNQQWHALPQDDGSYVLVAAESGKAMNVPQGASADGIALQQAGVTKASSQKWKLEKVENGIFKLTAECSGKALTIGGDGVNAPVIQKTYANTPDQQWKIEGL
jgi:hypothetical protein